ncbi:MAG: vitamin B12-dependent ribonucleotide reductase [Firmicutes bacterium]|jgi:ribonucleoside-diphosphate reductase alpha chain|nr:vitamin B12-dependent ribonucleotide reductase [Bacillota bacterium]NLO65524.1 vitamin B12-dependent ribonucleotide reductase [Bacillota bacterium]
MILTENARTVLERRYLKKEGDVVVETPEEMLRRVAKNIAQLETDPIWEEKFFEIMDNREFMPNSPTLMNAGRELQQLSACFVLPIEDSMDGIFETLKNTALIQKSGGGTGFSFSRLRPNSDMVSSTGGVASGPISFMKCYNAATDAIKQGGTRRGANMAILRVDHPDIIDFIKCKEDTSEITNFNISVGLTEEFMEAVLADETYPLINPRNQEQVGELRAAEVFDLIVEMAWTNGEPGIVFLDRINRDNPTPAVGEIEATNPCGEQPLLPNESCNLGSINLALMTKREGDQWVIDWDRLKEVVQIGVRFLDNVIEVNQYPIPEIDEMTKANRKIGLGVMGFADMLMRLRVPYNSEEGVQLAREIMSFIQNAAKEASIQLGEERGSFPNYDQSIFAETGRPMRNSTVTTIAPTGTISIIAGCSSGVEPIFALAFTRNVMDDDKLIEVNAQFEEILREEGLYSEDLIARVAKQGNVQGIEEIPEELRKVFVTAYEVTPEWHIRMQAAFQEFTDNAVSKTVNFPKEATREDIREVYMLAYELGCKGVTVYRAGSREGEVLQVGTEQKKEEQTASGRPHPSPRRRPTVTRGQTIRIKTGCGTLYVTINEDDQGICEVFTTIGKAGGCAGAFSEATARLISLSLRSGVEPMQIVKQLKGIRCPHPIWQDGQQVLSCPDAIAQVLEQYVKQNGVKDSELPNPAPVVNPVMIDRSQPAVFSGATCPDCGGTMVEESGCSTCLDCGFSRCS